MAIVSREGVRYSDLSGNPVVKETRRVSREDIVVDKGGHRHFMLKEIMDQPQAMTAALKDRADFANGRVNLPEFPLSPADVMQLERVVLIGCGTSLHAAQVGRHYIERLAGIPAEAESASEFRYRDPIIGPRTLVVSIGQSGETADTVAAMHLAREKGATLITICNAEESQAARVADGALYMHAGLEVGVASTKTFVASLTILQLLSVYLGQLRGKLDAETTRRLVDQMARGPGLIGEVLAEANLYSSLARRIGHYDNFLFLGRGANAAIASEGALKLKEISYIHAEGYPAGEMKHGPIALIDPEMCTVALAPRDDLRDKTLSNIKEVKARGGLVVAVLTKGDDEAASEVDFPLFIPQAPDLLMPLVTTVPLQLLSYYIALLRGCDVDQPRNLAKSVTVE
ncbi:Glutamine--fructose-6-phosphate aminotransferase [isomerizing] [Geodia barretti]|uniref:Glutamine--fructose-6-phosphate aminotransferase [isomerizing] n=4 Tax=Geodia barretti TaxID=519541 RepID=A0AA35RNQ3_GEOBA|nr:Glutamine--fructose-6-phosphate aminotransferase [isomerizing] [Geodia barretti]